MSSEISLAEPAAGWRPRANPSVLTTLEQRLTRDSGLIIAGPPHSGRTLMAADILTRHEIGIPPTFLTPYPGQEGEPMSLLRQIDPELPEGATAEHLAKRGLVPARVIVRDADTADLASLRALALLARRGLTKLVLTMPSSVRGLPDELKPLTVHRLAPFTVEQVSEVVGSRYGATVLPGDALRLFTEAGGEYRGVRWLVDRAQSADCVRRISNTLIFDQVPQDTVAPWELEGAGSSDLERAVAVAGELPLEWGRRQSDESVLLDLQEAGRLVVEAGQMRPATPAHGMETISRMMSERRRAVTRSLLEDWTLIASPKSEITSFAASRLVDAARDSGLSVPDELASLARTGFLKFGRVHAAALLPLAGDASVEERLLHALTLALAANHIKLVGVRDAGLTDDQRLEFAVILAVAELHHAPAKVSNRIDAVAESLPDAHTAVLSGFRAITLSMPGTDWAALAAIGDDPDLSDVVRSFALRVGAIRALLLGQPNTAAERLARARTFPVLPVQYGIDDVIASGALLFAPDLELDPRPSVFPPGLIPTHDLFGAMIALYRGDLDTGVGLIHAALRRPDAEAHPLAPIMHGFASFAASLLKHPDLAETHLTALRQASESLPLIAVGRKLTEGLAVVNLEALPTRIQDGHDLFAQTGDMAEAIGFRAFSIACRLGAAFVLDERQDSVLLQKVIASALDETPLEGVFRTYSLCAHAFLSDDTLTLASIAVSLHNQGFLLDAIGLSTHLPLSSSGLSRSMGRAIARLANFRVERVADRTGLDRILTPRETEIAKLASEGFTDREIAQQLGVSERTVNTHVTRVLKKLGIKSRNRIASALA